MSADFQRPSKTLYKHASKAGLLAGKAQYDHKVFKVEIKNIVKNYSWTRAARAKSAAPSHFQPLQHGHYSFVDGGPGFNNPSLKLVSGVALEFGWFHDTGCLLTIGTGIAPNGNVSDGDVPDLVSGLVATFTSCERAHEQMERISTGLPSSKDASKYYRFNVGKKLNAKFVREHVGGHFGYGGSDITVFKPEDFEKGIIEMDDWEAMDGFVKLTNAYMALDEQKARVDRCAQRLLKGAGAIAVKA